jgi:hypothetical protein
LQHPTRFGLSKVVRRNKIGSPFLGLLSQEIAEPIGQVAGWATHGDGTIP